MGLVQGQFVMRRIIVAVAGLVFLLFAAPSQAADVVAEVNITTQRLDVWVDGQRQYSWPVSTARRGYRSPVGSYRPQRMYRRYFSRKYDNSPMPYAIFFHGGYAIHGTTDLKRLGRPASHGCIRLHPGHAARLFTLVQTNGKNNTRIVITR